MNNMDMNALMGMLSKMDKKDLEAGLAKASQILSAKDKEAIINQLQSNKNNQNNQNNQNNKSNQNNQNNCR